MIVPLGGDSGFRASKALEILKSIEHRAKGIESIKTKVLIIGTAGQARDFASKSGIATENLFNDPTPKNTLEEGINTLALLKEKGWKRAIVVSDPYHMLRIRYVWGKVFKHSGIKFTLVADDLPYWNAKRWWENDFSRRYVISEYLKLAYFIYAYNTSGVRGKALGVRGIGKTDDTDTHTGTDFDDKEHERLRKIEKKWEDKINGWLVRFLAQSPKLKGER